MGCNVRDKSLRGNRRFRNSSKQLQQQQRRPPPDSKDLDTIPPGPNHLPGTANHDAHSDPSGKNIHDEAAATDLGYCTEEQLEDLLLAKLDFVYKEALARLSALGYDDDLALRAVLRNGHCYGPMDVLSNIVHNAIAYIDSPAANSIPADPSPPDDVCSFPDLRRLKDCALTGMVCLLQELQPHLSRGDAMWCLLMSDLHVGRASSVEVPVIPPPSNVGPLVPPGDAGGRSGDFGCSVAYGAYGFRKGGKEGVSSKMLLPAPQLEMPVLAEEEAGAKNSEVMASVLKSMENMSLEETACDSRDNPRNEMIQNLVNQIRDLEEQVKDRKEWAQQKAMQAARKLSNDIMELKLLRMERDDNQRLKKGKHTLEDTTMKRLSEMENALRKASGQVDHANAAVRQLEAENAELRAEMEAAKLSNAESERTCLEISKREKKYLKKLVAREKQRERMEEEVVEVRKSIAEVQQKLIDINNERKIMEANLKESIKAKEQAVILVEEERRLKEAAEECLKRKHDTLRRKNEIDLQRQKDDIQRLEDELSRLRSSACSHSPGVPLYLHHLGGANGVASQNQQEPCQKVGRDRKCVMCNKDEVSVVFLPCAHQILCAKCNENHESRAKTCPCCVVVVEQRIRVYGASS